MSVSETDPQRAMCNYFGESKIGRFNIEVAFYDLKVGGDGAQEVVSIFVGEVA